MAESFCVSISKEYAELIRKHKLSPSDCFKRGVSLSLRERDFSDEDNPLQLKEKILKITTVLNQKCQDYELLRSQYETLRAKILSRNINLQN